MPFFAGELSFVARFGFGFGGCFAVGGALGVFFAVPGFTEVGVGGGGAVGGAFVCHFAFFIETESRFVCF